MQNIATGKFEIDMTFKDAADTEIPKIGEASFDKVFSGELTGNSLGLFLSIMTGREDSASYVAIETVTGKLNGRHGSFAFLQLGIMDRGQQHLTYKIVPDSGTDELVGITGDLKLGDDHHYEISYQLPD